MSGSFANEGGSALGFVELNEIDLEVFAVIGYILSKLLRGNSKGRVVCTQILSRQVSAGAGLKTP